MTDTTSTKPADLKLRKLASFRVPEFPQRMLLLDGGRAAAVIGHKRTVDVLHVDGATRSHELPRAPGAADWTREYGALFAFRAGFAAVVDESVALFDSADATPRILHVTNPMNGPIQAGVPLPAHPHRAVYDAANDRVIVLFDERQMSKRLSFLGSLRIGDTSAAYDVTARTLELPPDDARFTAATSFDASRNHPIMVDVGVIDGRAVVASYGRAVDVAMWRKPRMHVFALDHELRATEVVAAPETEGYTACAFGADGADHPWLGYSDVRGSRSSKVVFEDLRDGRRYRVNLKSKRVDFTPLKGPNATCFGAHGSVYWQCDGASAVNAYEIVR